MDSKSDSDLNELTEKLDRELDEFIAQKVEESKERRKNEPEEKEDFAALLESIENHPAFMNEIDVTKPLSTATEALMALKYECEDPKEQATNYKDDGNEEFKKKKYDVAIDNYTEAIKCKCDDKLLNAILYTNRGTANYYLGNFRSALNDCTVARKFKNDHVKAIFKGSQCLYELKKFSDCLIWCDHGLLLNNKDQLFLTLRYKADNSKKFLEKENRRKLAIERKESEKKEYLLASIKERKIKLSGDIENAEIPRNRPVHLDKDNVLNWPVMFLYPEPGESDFIESFCETSSFYDHLTHMFAEEMDPPPWDDSRKYTSTTIEIYFEDKKVKKLYKIDSKSTLLSALQHKRYTVEDGTPCFFLLSKETGFRDAFLELYEYAQGS